MKVVGPLRLKNLGWQLLEKQSLFYTLSQKPDGLIKSQLALCTFQADTRLPSIVHLPPGWKKQFEDFQGSNERFYDAIKKNNFELYQKPSKGQSRLCP